MNRYVLSADLGQMSDPTAITITERVAARTGKLDLFEASHGLPGQVRTSMTWNVRWLERPELHTPYDKIIERIVGLMGTPEMKDNCDLIVDATGVGRPVVDMFTRMGLDPIPITFTGGKEFSYTETGYHVPKRDIAMSLRILFDSRRIKIPGTLPMAAVIYKECANFVVKITKAGNDTYEAWREKEHDDLVFSVAMMAWYESMQGLTMDRIDSSLREKEENGPYDPFSYLDE